MLLILVILSAVAYSESASCQRPVCRLESDKCNKLTEKKIIIESCFKTGKFEQLIDEIYDNRTILTISYGTEESKVVGNNREEQLKVYRHISKHYSGYTVLKFFPTKVFTEDLFIIVEGTFRLESKESKSYITGIYYQKYTFEFITVEHVVTAIEKDGHSILCKLDSAVCHKLADRQSIFESTFSRGDFEALVDELYNNDTILTIGYGNGEDNSVGTNYQDQITMYYKIIDIYVGYSVLKFYVTKIVLDNDFYVVEGTFKLENKESGSYISGHYYQKFNLNFITVEHFIKATEKDGHNIICQLDTNVCLKLDERQHFFENNFRNQSFEELINEMYTNETVLTISYVGSEEAMVGKTKEEQLVMHQKLSGIYQEFTLMTLTPTTYNSEAEIYMVSGTFTLKTSESSSSVSGIYFQVFNSEFKTVIHKIEATESEDVGRV